ncbi:hypothetical protein B0I37DRAFT_352332 [Chaetomium sp. MPI-CAGE-AT-0009]|nr:hypothetical protein B0I37DRAFT_352332 [Chaetomium sp. MPI-CAGE-AT-0009]
MSWDYDSLPREGPGCLITDHKGGYVYAPYDESREGLPRELEDRIDKLEHWFKDPANLPMLRQMDQILEREVDDKCYWEFLDGGSASRIDFHGKIKMLAKYRLSQSGVDVSPNNPRHPKFKLVIADVAEFGHVKMKGLTLNWHCTESQVVKALEAFSNPQFSHEAVLGRLLKDLDTIHHPEDLAQEAQSLAETFKSEPPITNGPEWKYLLYDERDKLLKKSPNVIKMMKRESRDASKLAVIIRSSLLEHYNRCKAVFDLQRGQMKHCQETDPALEEPYFNGG